jgi:L-iditol 2-dehydrogenase
MVTGHEWSGVVVALGEGACGVKVGERVAADWHGPCGHCYYCRRGLPNYCEDLHRRQGGFAGYCLARASGLHILPAAVTADEAAFCEPLACCLNGVESLRLNIGDNVAVVGCGPIGLMHVQLARARGARVVAVDMLPDRLEAARRLGAQDVVSASESDPVKEVKRLTEGRGANGVVVTVGDPAAVTGAVQMVAATGTVNLFAGFYPDGNASFDFNQVHYRQLTITGSHNFLPRHFDAALQAIEHGLVDVKALISEVLPLEEIARGFDLVAERKSLKILIAPNDLQG